MSMPEPPANRIIDEQAALRAVVEGTAGETGQAFYGALVENLARALDTCGAWVTEYFEERRRLRALAFWFEGDRLDGLEYDIRGTACETAVTETRLVHIPDQLLTLYSGETVGSIGDDPGFAEFRQRMRRRGVVSYLGMPLLGENRKVLGHVAVLDRRPMPHDERMQALFEIFANRALAELLRLRLEAELREREEKLGRVVGSAMDGIIEFDGVGNVTLMNAAAEKIFGGAGSTFVGGPLARLLAPEARDKLDAFVRRLAAAPVGEQVAWIAGGLTARRVDGSEFPAEATLSRYEIRRSPFHTLILRNVDDRLEAERTIRSLTAQTEYLREEIRSEHDFRSIIGESQAIARVLRDVGSVAATDATVLITGETGTGKELFARAIHEASRRRDQPLITVNCAAVPANLIESEFFGHERGAFTGATQRRQGRFELADGGTIFLDEIGDLPLDLQGKLLRVLQEGAFEPVGSSRTHRVDVRVLSATNRDLGRDAREGRFREDLYYRLNVFPLHLPPLRERGGDVVRIAESLARSLAPRLGRPPATLSTEDAVALRAYAWPGNVRELRNVMERALITSRDGRLRLASILPVAQGPAGRETVGDAGTHPIGGLAGRAGAASAGERAMAGESAPTDAAAPAVRPEGLAPDAGRRGEVLTIQALRELERANLERALETAGGRIGGPGGAAALLGIKPSTLRSRMAAFGIRKTTAAD
jgi:PAS domain S-box-containing protein